MTAEAGSASEDQLLREESTPGPADAGSMFAALLQEMKKMKENILAKSEPAKSSEGSPERNNNASELLDERVAVLTASGTSEPNVLADIAHDLDASKKKWSSSRRRPGRYCKLSFERELAGREDTIED